MELVRNFIAGFETPGMVENAIASLLATLELIILRRFFEVWGVNNKKDEGV